LQRPPVSTDYADNIYWVYGCPRDSYQFDGERRCAGLAWKKSVRAPSSGRCMSNPFRQYGLFENIVAQSERLARRGFYVPSGMVLRHMNRLLLLKSFRRFYRQNKNILLTPSESHNLPKYAPLDTNNAKHCKTVHDQRALSALRCVGNISENPDIQYKAGKAYGVEPRSRACRELYTNQAFEFDLQNGFLPDGCGENSETSGAILDIGANMGHFRRHALWQPF